MSLRGRSKESGRRAESIAAWWLRLKGYRILEQRFRVPVGEIDLIARRGRVIAVVEVKERTSLSRAAEAISPRQRGRIERAALAYLRWRPLTDRMSLRFDVILVAPGRLPRHLPDAWRPNPAGS